MKIVDPVCGMAMEEKDIFGTSLYKGSLLSAPKIIIVVIPILRKPPLMIRAVCRDNGAYCL
jgi:hypothetical protein